MKKNTNKIALGILLFVGILYLCFPLYYLLHSRVALLNDYCAATPSFYRKALFTSSVFTEGLKQQARLLCLLSFGLLVISGFLIIPFLKIDCKQILRAQWLKIRASAIWLLLLVFLTISLFVYGNALHPLCTDEAFSIVNFAQQPLVHLLTYYPLPNNHIFFNLINHFAGKVSGDYLLSGRIISGLFYVLLICSNYLFVQKIVHNKFISFLCSTLLAQQLMIWGFGAQARGYSLYYFLQWTALVSFYDYFFGKTEEKKQMLLVLIISNVFGLYTIPSFLYWILFEVLTALVLMVHFRQLFLDFWKAMLLIASISFLLYLPVFCYSGLASVFGNKYIAGVGLNRTEIVQLFFKYFSMDIAAITFGFASFYSFMAFGCFFIPLILFAFFRKKLNALAPFLVFGLCSWLAVFLIVVLTKQVPIFRAIGFQMHLSLLVFLLLMVSVFRQLFRQQFWQYGICSILILSASVQIFNQNKSIANSVLYGYSTDTHMNILTQEKLKIESDQSVWISDESYMFNFLLDKQVHPTNFDCSFHNQDILILSEDDKINPLIDLKQYKVIQKVSLFTIFQRNE